MSNYQPKRAAARWLDQAPAYVLSVHDAGPEANDRYTVCFGWPLWSESMGRTVPYLGFNEAPSSPNMGVSMWGECEAHRQGLKKIRWLDLPETLRKHVIGSVESGPDPVIVVTLINDKSHGWVLIAADGKGGYGPDFKNKAEAVKYAKDNLMVIKS